MQPYRGEVRRETREARKTSVWRRIRAAILSRPERVYPLPKWFGRPWWPFGLKARQRALAFRKTIHVLYLSSEETRLFQSVLKVFLIVLIMYAVLDAWSH
jgi:hypothetical protein